MEIGEKAGTPKAIEETNSTFEPSSRTSRRKEL